MFFLFVFFFFNDTATTEIYTLSLHDALPISEWLSVLLEVQARLRHDPKFVRRLEARTEDQEQRFISWLRARQADGTFRDDVDFMALGRFAAMVLNGLALRVVGGAPTEIEPILELLHDALGP